MMVISIISLIISFLLQGITSNYLGYGFDNLSYFFTIYPLINLMVLNPYFENEKKHLSLIIIVGLLIDLIYTNTFMFNIFIFLIIYYVSKCFYFRFPYNLFTINISNLLGIFLYHIISFIFLTVLRYDSYSISVLQKILTHSILMTVIYSSILHVIIEHIDRKLELKHIK